METFFESFSLLYFFYMTADRWEDLIGRLTYDGKLESRETEELEGRPGTADRAIVATPFGRIRLSWTSEPKRLSEKAFYSKRGGSTVNVKIEYDESDIIHVFSIDRFDATSARWVHVDPANFQI